MADASFEELIGDLKEAASGRLDLDGLRKVRLLLVSDGFARHLDDTIARAHNQPEALAIRARDLLTIKFGFRDQLADSTEQQRLLAVVAVGGGSTVVGGGILAIATQSLVFPPLALLAVAAGGYAAWRGAIANRRLAMEISCLHDIVEVLDRHVRALQEPK